MIPRTKRLRTGNFYEAYFCNNRRHDPDSCTMEPVSRAKVDEAVLAYFSGLDLAPIRR